MGTSDEALLGMTGGLLQECGCGGGVCVSFSPRRRTTALLRVIVRACDGRVLQQLREHDTRVADKKTHEKAAWWCHVSSRARRDRANIWQNTR